MSDSANSPRPTITIDDIREARSRCGPEVLETPLTFSHSFSRMTGHQVWLKAECLQRTGSFKIRGATNVLSRLGGRPVVAASAGNHAQGVALAAATAGSRCTVFMPANAPIPKIKATQDYGATVELVGTSLAEAVEAAHAHAERTGSYFVHPYDDPLVIAGQGTLGLEIAEQLPGVGTVVIPLGGGGLLAGSAIALTSTVEGVHMVGVESAAADTYVRSRAAGHPVRVEPRSTVADGINVTVPSTLVFEILQARVPTLLTVDDAQAAEALTLSMERAKLVVEPAGAVGLAALLAGGIPPEAPDPVVVVLSGGNVDLLLLGKMVRHGLESSGRYADFRVWVPDQPGELVSILNKIAALGGNVVEVEHHREGFALPFGTVEIDISIETRGPDHTAEIAAALAPYLPASSS